MGLSTRTLIAHVVFWGFAVHYLDRTNLAFAIVSMVEQRSDVIVRQPECSVLTLNHTIKPQEGYRWDEHEQSLILGSYYWLHWTTQLPGGMLAHRYGTKRVFGFSNLGVCLLGMLIPFAAKGGLWVLIALRMTQGILAGFCWPSMHNLTASWVPPNERSKFVSTYLGSIAGAGLALSMNGLLISWFNWPIVFITTGLAGLVWFMVWWSVVYDTPAGHPHIDKSEVDYIRACLGQTVAEEKPPIPWKQILQCRTVWLTSLCHSTILWGWYTLLAEAPTYFKSVYGIDILLTGGMAGVPYLCCVVFAFAFSYFADKLLTQEAVSRTAMRKIATFMGTVGQSLFIFGLAWCGCNWVAAVLCVTLATMTLAGISTGPLATFVDLSPNFASATLGISSTMSALPGMLAPMLVGFLTLNNLTIERWRLVFLIVSAILVVPGLLYVSFASVTLQSWNSPGEEGGELRPQVAEQWRLTTIEKKSLADEKQRLIE